MGGMIGQMMAVSHPARVASLTLVCTAAGFDADSVRIVRGWRASRPHGDPLDFVLMLSSWLFTYRFLQQSEAVQQFLQLVSSNPFPQSVEGFQRQCDAVMTFDARDRVSRITAPTHVIVGTEDNLTPPRYARWLADRIATADAFNQVLLGFLQAQAT
jgi:pimeloyl-ACP methyl ester carboxylesterase